MAKSERKSKWKKKFRAIRREKCKKKDLLILSSILAQKCSPPVETRPPRDSNKMEASAADSIETQVKGKCVLFVCMRIFSPNKLRRLTQTNPINNQTQTSRCWPIPKPRSTIQRQSATRMATIRCG